MKRYLASSREEAANNIPLLFVTSPSAKDPTWEMRHPGEAGTTNACEGLQSSCWGLVMPNKEFLLSYPWSKLLSMGLMECTLWDTWMKDMEPQGSGDIPWVWGSDRVG